MMTRQEEARDWIDTCRGHSDKLVEEGHLARAVELFLQQMKRSSATADQVSTALRAEGLAAVSQGADVVRAWLRKF